MISFDLFSLERPGLARLVEIWYIEIIMPAKNRIKEYEAESFYHIYNRGVNKNLVFSDEQDYAVFLSYLKTYLTPKDTEYLYAQLLSPTSSNKEKEQAKKLLRMNNFYGEIKLISYVLMPNHFHLYIWQKGESSMDKFMNSLCTRYSMFFNKKLKRVGPVFQSVYKAVRVISDEQSLYLIRYIHRNPSEILATKGQALRSYEYSSYPVYLGVRKNEWVSTDDILSQFSKTGNNSFERFIEEEDDEKYQIVINNICLDSE